MEKLDLQIEQTLNSVNRKRDGQLGASIADIQRDTKMSRAIISDSINSLLYTNKIELYAVIGITKLYRSIK